MEPSDNNGPDASSIRPVSSLRARFENMSKPADAQPAAPPALALTPTRSVSPVQKPERLRDANAPSHEPPPPVPLKSKPKENVFGSLGHQPAALTDSLPRSPARAGPPPPLSPRPIPPPSLLVQPPQSPPKGRISNTLPADSAAYLNPDAIAKPASPSGSPRQFKIPSRPHTPTVELGRSPRLSPAHPPSPPPPRRSAELRRDRESRAAPPVINRADKPKIPAHHAHAPDSAPVPEPSKARTLEKHSPFSSPPSSAESQDEDVPPALPTRPRRQVDTPPRPKSIQLTFEPPPVHHSVATWRTDREHEANGSTRGPLAPQLTGGEPRPPLPTRPTAPPEHRPLMRNNTVALRPPPRPPRPGVSTSGSDFEESSGLQQKRAISNPTSQYPPPPARTHGRSMTMDRTPTRVPSEFYAPPPSSNIVATTAESRGTDSVLIPSSRVDQASAYPDATNTNRRPPYIKQGVHEISTKYDSRIFDVCGEMVCTTGHLTRVWSLLDGEMLMSLAHGEGLKATSVAFKPGANVDEEGARLWIGNSVGEVMEADIATQSIVCSKPMAHGRHEVIKIYRHRNEMWTLDEGGTLHVWGPDEDGTPNLAASPHQSFRVPKGHTFSIVAGDELWHATGKEIRVFLPTVDGKTQFQVLVRALSQEGAGEVTSGTMLAADPSKVFFGHVDGKVSIYSRKEYSCLALVNVSTYKINSLAGVGKYMWAGFNTGKVCVYDVEQTPWAVKKDWQAHDNPVVKIIADGSSFYKLDRSQVISLGADNMLRAWDGLLQEDWLETEMQGRDASYCDFEEIRALVMTWNAGASTPNSLRYSESDASFVQNLLQSSNSPDILVFGFQELVDLEDKTATAKRFLKVKKKEGSDQERMSHQYRDWRDFLVRSLDDYMSGELYHLLQVAHLVGLFTCIFVKADLRDRISNVSSAEIKRGMGGLHGNKGAIAVRFMIDNTSMCFINCHLAAGQSQATHRHNDIAAILESAIFPVERDSSIRIDSYVGGGDGTMILDHELCVLNGDLNYRVDTMSRDTVVTAVKAGNLAKLLERDQLLVARRRNPGFRLRAFDELPITFAPTYKYDVGTDNYDSSEKKRSPAWCDRLLYRGRGRIKQLDYRRHEVRVSDHRPVSGRFRFTVKRIRLKDRAVAWMECQQGFEDLRAKTAQDAKMYYLTHVIGYDEMTSQDLIRQKSSKRALHRSPSRHRE